MIDGGTRIRFRMNVAGRVQGNLSSGFMMTDAQLVGPLAFDPNNPETTGVAGLIKAIQEGRATIVVHQRPRLRQQPDPRRCG